MLVPLGSWRSRETEGQNPFFSRRSETSEQGYTALVESSTEVCVYALDSVTIIYDKKIWKGDRKRGVDLHHRFMQSAPAFGR